MGILFPLYLLGFLGLAAPIFFHFRQKQTKDITKFGSLIFLEAAPIKQRTQSQIQHWLLLLVRCLIIALLALAFARPLFRSAIAALEGDEPEKVVILLDKSASMRRDGLWDDAVAKLEEVLETLKEDDLVHVSVYDSKVTPIITFDEAAEVGSGRNEQILEAVKELEPTWESTDLGRALVGSVEAIEEGVDQEGQDEEEGDESVDAEGRVVVITDGQDGASIEQLKAFLWPEGVALEFETIQTKNTTNASIQLLPEPKGIQQNKSGRSFRIENGEASKIDVFNVRWRNADGTVASEEMLVKVPAGEAEVLKAPATSTGLPASILELTGDDHDFDNRSYTEAIATKQLRVLYVGSEAENDPQSALFFLRRALFPTRTMVPELKIKLPDDTFEGDVLRYFDLVVVAGEGELPNAGRFTEYVEQGGRILYLLHDAAAVSGLGKVLGMELSGQDGQVQDFLLLGTVNRRHPLLAAFSDARFGDFSNVHFWNYRKLDPKQIPGVTVLGAFDNGDPAWLLKSQGKGSVLAFTSSWRRGDSQLALSTKFIPLLYAILSNQSAVSETNALVHVGEPFPVSVPRQPEVTPDPPQEEAPDVDGEGALETPPVATRTQVTITYPSGKSVPLIDGEDVFRETSEPGLYSVRVGDKTSVVAVNLDPEESELDAMDTDVVRKMIEPKEVDEDIADAAAASTADGADGGGKDRAKDLKREKRQRLWRLLVSSVLVFVLFEIWYSAYCRRKELKSQETGG